MQWLRKFNRTPQSFPRRAPHERLSDASGTRSARFSDAAGPTFASTLRRKVDLFVASRWSGIDATTARRMTVGCTVADRGESALSKAKQRGRKEVLTINQTPVQRARNAAATVPHSPRDDSTRLRSPRPLSSPPSPRRPITTIRARRLLPSTPAARADSRGSSSSAGGL